MALTINVNVLMGGCAAVGMALGYMTSLKHEYNCEQSNNPFGLEKYIYRGLASAVGGTSGFITPLVTAYAINLGLKGSLATLCEAITVLGAGALFTFVCVAPIVPIGMAIYLMNY